MTAAARRGQAVDIAVNLQHFVCGHALLRVVWIANTRPARMWGLVFWGAALGGFYMLSSFLEERAAMRGTHRRPLPSWVDKGIRLVFMCILLFPVYAIFPWPWLFFAGAVCYVPSYLDNGEKTGKRVSGFFKDLPIFRFVRWYFALKIDPVGGKLDATRKYIIGLHPHGFLPIGTMVAVMSNACSAESVWLNGTRLYGLAASFCFYIPGYRDFILAGGIIDAARYNARRAIESGCSVALVPGGATEGLYASPGKHILVLNKRKGFIKLALETGCDLVPCYSFGESDCYDQLSSMWPPIKKFQAKFQRVLGLSLPLVTNIIPRRAQITVVTGTPIVVTKNASPTDEEVLALHAKYVAALRELFDQNAPRYIKNPSERKLEII